MNWKIAQLTQLNSAPGTNSAHIIWDTALYDSDQTVVRTALNVFDNRKIPRALSVEELIWIQARIGTASWSEARAWAYILANSGLATNALLLSIIADRYVAEVRAPPAILTTYGVGSAYIQGEALFYHQWLRVFRLSDHALSRRILRVKHRQATEPRVRFWLDFARGTAGDEEVAERLLSVVEDEAIGVSYRAVALSAFAGAAGSAAVPVLERCKTDRGPSVLTDVGRRMVPLSVVTNQELQRMKQGSGETPATGAVPR